MITIETSAYHIAKRFIGLKEVPGKFSNPQILTMLQLDNKWPLDDSVPWCSAMVNYVAFLLDLKRSKSLRARSWINVGIPLQWHDAEKGIDIVVLKRGKGEQPGPEVINAPGHVGFFDCWVNDGKYVSILGGNQNDSVNISNYRSNRILSINRLVRN